MSRIAESTWMLGYFACLLLSVIHVLGVEVSTPEAFVNLVLLLLLS
jgi:hypothetical protein